MDTVFRALADETRRAILDLLLARDGQTLSELEAALNDRREMTRFGVMKHLKVLEEANLVIPRRAGRFKHHHLNVVPLQEVADRWIEPLVAGPVARHILDFKSQLEGNSEMSDAKPSFVMSTYIRCTQDALWDALTQPDRIALHQFMPVVVKGAVIVGDRLVYELPDGETMLAETVLEVEPKSRLAFTFEPGWQGEKPEISRFVYEIDARDGQCRLTILHYELTQDLDGIGDGWAKCLASLKSLLETGEPLAFSNAA